VSLSAWLQAELAATAPERLAVPAASATGPGAAVILVTVAFFSGLGFLSDSFAAMPLWTVWALIAVALVAWRLREPYPLHVALLCALAALAYATPGFGGHPFPLLGALCGYVVFVLGSRRLRESLDWARLGVWSRRVTRLVLLLGALPLVSLPLWRLLADPDVEGPVGFVAGIPVFILPLVAVFFALVNALAEEITFSGGHLGWADQRRRRPGRPDPAGGGVRPDPRRRRAERGLGRAAERPVRADPRGAPDPGAGDGRPLRRPPAGRPRAVRLARRVERLTATGRAALR
jgi:hypothetical protein